MNDTNLIIDKIRGELQKGLPSKRKILVYFVDLLNKDKYPSLNDYQFYDIIGETYQLNRDYNLNLMMLFNPIYKDVRKKIKRLYGKEKVLEMEQYLAEKYGFITPEEQRVIHQIQDTPISLPKRRRFDVFLVILMLSVTFILTGLLFLLEVNPLIIIGIICIICIFTSIDYCYR